LFVLQPLRPDAVCDDMNVNAAVEKFETCLQSQMCA